MKIATKKLRCPNCEKVVHVSEQKKDDLIQIVCSHCHEVIRVWDGIKWLEVRKP